jgi:signal transduction histidine kinase
MLGASRAGPEGRRRACTGARVGRARPKQPCGLPGTSGVLPRQGRNPPAARSAAGSAFGGRVPSDEGWCQATVSRPDGSDGAAPPRRHLPDRGDDWTRVRPGRRRAGRSRGRPHVVVRTTRALGSGATVLIVELGPAFDRARRYGAEALAVALGIGLQIEIWAAPLREPRWAMSLLGALAAGALLFRSRAPLGAPLATFAAMVATSFAAPDTTYDSSFTFFIVLLATWSVAASNPFRQALAGFGVGLAGTTIVVRRFPDETAGDFVWISLIFTTTWLLGYAMNYRAQETRRAEERVERLVAEREERDHAAVAEERQRIARELHDVISHSVSVMTVQAGGVRRLLHPEQTREREALETVEETGRQALADMRRMLGVLRDANEETALLTPQPGIGSLGSLIQQVREAGLTVDYRVQGEPTPLPAGVDLSAYRIVQEALTNALKHARHARAEVKVRYGDVLELEITNDGRFDANGAGDSGGHGLVGMRERVALFGGTIEAGPRPSGGYAVRARLPVRDAAE